MPFSPTGGTAAGAGVLGMDEAGGELGFTCPKGLLISKGFPSLKGFSTWGGSSAAKGFSGVFTCTWKDPAG